jgi:hypothetical protein
VERHDLGSGEQPDPVRAVNMTDEGAELFAQDPFQRVPARKDRGDLHAELCQGSGHLAADEPHAHHHRAPSGLGFALDGVALRNRAQVVDPWQLGPGKLQPAVASSRRDQQLLVCQFPPGPQGQRVRRRIECDHGVGAEVHVVRLVPVGRLDVPVGEILFGS